MPQKSAALKFVILLGFVSLCADATYEGARSITGAYLQVLGASGTVVGLVAGFGELIGYGLRLVIGYLSDQTRKYWGITTLGFILNTAVVPLLAFAGRWEVAAGLMMAERTGKAVRTPPRDALLSHGVSQIGRGFGFGLHEAMDQTGAVMGPLAVAAMVYFQGEYRNGFTILIVPAVLGLIVLLVLQFLYPNPSDLEIEHEINEEDGIPRAFWIYLGAVAIIAAGYADFPLIAFHFQKGNIASGQTIPLFYAFAMGVDAVAALIFGYLFDRAGISILMVAAFVSSFFAPLVFFGDTQLALLGIAFWGIGMGAQESILKAAIAGLVPKNKRATAYGIFSTGYGFAWFLGSTLMGVLYDRSLTLLVVFSTATQLLAIPFFVWVQLQANKSKL
ncbi:MFS transporter [Nostoc sp. FACHB-152]|uniref:MFS transporter n=1 Tax=unclassified Nostoc TaxID=2593658 RepID=UPI001688AA12|nr:MULTISPECIES: MFS transporter [unclassified Nostoc]MBD2445707.1 MFS transporter [Nostoc sp. FACHB-152]MBD2466821.1 MFS transporter [Nostoc sp. FACHB-145]